MNCFNYIFITIAFLISQLTCAQNDTIPLAINKKTLLKKAIIPTFLIGSSLIITNSTFEINLQKDLRKGIKSDFDTQLDDYIRFAPIAQMYIADLITYHITN